MIKRQADFLSRSPVDPSVRKDLRIQYLLELIAERSLQQPAVTPPLTEFRPRMRELPYHHNMPHASLVSNLGRFANGIMVGMAGLGLASSMIFAGSIFTARADTTRAATQTPYRQESPSQVTPKAQTKMASNMAANAEVAGPAKAVASAKESVSTEQGTLSKQLVASATPSPAPQPSPTLTRTALAPYPTPSPIISQQIAAPSKQVYRTHVVQPGQNLYRIGLLYGMTVDVIAAANGISNQDAVYAGQTLLIP